MALKREIKKFCECGKQQAKLLPDGRIRIFRRCECKPIVPGSCSPSRLVSQHSWTFIDNTPSQNWRKEFQYLLDRKILSRDELAYLFGQIKSIVDREIKQALKGGTHEE